MRPRWFLTVLILLCSTAAEASTISVLGGPVVDLLPNTAGQQIVVLISGTDLYTHMTLRTSINGGVAPAPRVTAVFNHGVLGIPTANLAGSVWESNIPTGIRAAIHPYPNNTTEFEGTVIDDPNEGLSTWVSAVTANGIAQNTAGILAILTLSTEAYSTEVVHGEPLVTFTIAPGQYTLSFEGTELFNGFDELEEGLPVPLQFAAVTLNVLPVPEPSAYALAAMGMVGLLVYGRRRGKH
jgi:hypothetical protein